MHTADTRIRSRDDGPTAGPDRPLAVAAMVRTTAAGRADR